MITTWYIAAESGDEYDRLLNAWEDAPFEQLELLGMLLEVAKEQVIAYAPALAEGEPLPARYVLGQLEQAKNLWAAGTVSSDGNIGDGGYSFTPRPMDKTVRGIIRPRDGRPSVL
ncbi:hypothetical protein SK224_00230 [Microbacterium sp. BG28]|uniref:hypothetical protein n=1 Tax=Microbacterium sp. BG28 TaxID=3097356 RepID=UPI002A5A5443|nr:hypothetical protein [Microbacterium sp. BG28]MDY0827546.1 hypothetical protein [Microbacterium sp. BG28]